MEKRINKLFSLVLVSVGISSYSLYESLDLIAFKYKETIIENTRSIVVEGEVFFRFKDNYLVTYMFKPFKSLVRIKATGDVEIYDFEKNTVMVENSIYSTSQQSYLWYFLSKNYSDVGLAKSGYSIKETKIEGDFLLQYWTPKNNNTIKYILLVHNKNQLPIYQEIVSKSGEVKGKIYFMNYMKKYGINIPSKIVDVYFKSKKDSSVSIKEYTNPTINNQVNLYYLNFKLPANVQIINK